MYHIHGDKRVQRSAEIIINGLMKCLKTKPVSDLSVSDVASAATISRATFYRIFDTPTDALTYLCDTLAEEVVAEHSTFKATTRDEFVLHTLTLWMQRSDKLEAIMRSGRHDLLQAAFGRHSEQFNSDSPQIFDKSEIDYVKGFFAATMCSILYVWTIRGKRETPEQLLQVFKKLAIC